MSKMIRQDEDEKRDELLMMTGHLFLFVKIVTIRDSK